MKRYILSLSIAICLSVHVHAQYSTDSSVVAQERYGFRSGPDAENVEGKPGVAPDDTTRKAVGAPEPGMDEFIYVDKMPQVVKRGMPVYPEDAKKQHREGMVYVKVLVGADGKPKKAAVIQSDTPVFNQPSIDAAMDFQFSPAEKDNKPVSVWVSIPFKYKLAEGTGTAKKVNEPPKPVRKPTVSVITGPKTLEKSIKYPEAAVRQRKEGQVSVSVELNGDKRISAVKVTSGIGAGCDEAVLRAVVAYNFIDDRELSKGPWPGTLPVVVQFMLPPKK